MEEENYDIYAAGMGREYTMESYPDVLTASLGTGDGGSEDDGPW